MINENKKIALSGIKPTGRPHIGNYFGAMKQFVDLQNKYDMYIFAADLHALTTVQNKKEMNDYIFNIFVDLLAIGLNPEKVILYKQSDIPQVAELGWIFNCITSMPYLMRAHAFKDAEAKNKDINVGVFDYPMLMAADILIVDADVVPVGEDQKQHVEFARDTGQKFNRIFGETLKIPEELIIKGVGTILGIDGKKMSKSYGNTIELFATDEELKKSVMNIVTDSKGVKDAKNPKECLIFYFHKLFTPKDELGEIESRYIKGGIGYKESKDILLKNLITFIKPMRDKRDQLLKDRNYVLKVIKEGGEKANKKAEKKMEEIRDKVGLKIK